NTGKEKWRVDMRSKTFPGAHPLNGTYASPILAGGKSVVAGGALEQGVRLLFPKYEGFTGRGFVVALEPQSGRIAWKYDVGPKPERLDPPIKIKDAWGEHVFQFGPATSTVWSTPSYHAASRTIFFGTDTNNAPRRPTPDDPRLDTRYACAVIAIDAGDGSEKWVTQINRGDVWNGRMRAYDPEAGRYLDLSIGDTPRVFTIMWNGMPTLVIGFGCKNGGVYIVRAPDGMILAHTPPHNRPPTHPPHPPPHKPTLATPRPISAHWLCPAQSAACRPVVPTTASACIRTVSTPSGLGLRNRAPQAFHRLAGAPWRLAWIPKRSTGATIGPRWRPWAARPPSPSSRMAAIRGRLVSPSPTASSISRR